MLRRALVASLVLITTSGCRPTIPVTASVKDDASEYVPPKAGKIFLQEGVGIPIEAFDGTVPPKDNCLKVPMIRVDPKLELTERDDGTLPMVRAAEGLEGELSLVEESPDYEELAAKLAPNADFLAQDGLALAPNTNANLLEVRLAADQSISLDGSTFTYRPDGASTVAESVFTASQQALDASISYSQEAHAKSRVAGASASVSLDAAMSASKLEAGLAIKIVKRLGTKMMQRLVLEDADGFVDETDGKKTFKLSEFMDKCGRAVVRQVTTGANLYVEGRITNDALSASVGFSYGASASFDGLVAEGGAKSSLTAALKGDTKGSSATFTAKLFNTSGNLTLPGSFSSSKDALEAAILQAAGETLKGITPANSAIVEAVAMPWGKVYFKLADGKTYYVTIPPVQNIEAVRKFLGSYRKMHKEANRRMLIVMNVGKQQTDANVNALKELSSYLDNIEGKLGKCLTEAVCNPEALPVVPTPNLESLGKKLKEDKFYRFHVVSKGKTYALDANSSTNEPFFLVADGNENNRNQHWRYDNKTKRLQSSNTGRCLVLTTIRHNDVEGFFDLKAEECSDLAGNQRWIILPNGQTGKDELRPATLGGSCLDLDSAFERTPGVAYPAHTRPDCKDSETHQFEVREI